MQTTWPSAFFIRCFIVFCNTGGIAQESRKRDAPTLFPVRQDGKWGYIDRAGKLVINPQYDAARGFAEGLALVKTNGKYGYIDRTGQLTIRPQFDNAHHFNGGLARVW